MIFRAKVPRLRLAIELSMLLGVYVVLIATPAVNRHSPVATWLMTLLIFYPALSSLVPVGFAGLRRSTRHRRWMNGRCRHCGYDTLHGGDRCPECGRRAYTAERIEQIQHRQRDRNDKRRRLDVAFVGAPESALRERYIYGACAGGGLVVLGLIGLLICKIDQDYRRLTSGWQLLEITSAAVACGGGALLAIGATRAAKVRREYRRQRWPTFS